MEEFLLGLGLVILVGSVISLLIIATKTIIYLIKNYNEW